MSELPIIPTDDLAYWQDPYPYLADIRSKSRVARTADGTLAVLHWQDGVDAMKGEQFIAEGVEVLERKGFKPGDPLHTWRKHAIGTMEGADHRRVRGLTKEALGRTKIETLRPIIRQHANALLDRKISEGEMEVMQDYALALPRLTMMDFLGIAPDELAATQGPLAKVPIVDCFGPNVTPELRAAANVSIQASMDHVRMLYEKRRSSPKDDLLTHLVEARDEHGVLSEGELVTLFSSIFGAGASTTSIITSGFLELAQRPDQARLFRSDPDGLKQGASEETLRHRPAINAIGLKAAETTRAFDLDEEIQAGTPISVILGAVNRDPAHWDDPDRFDITRPTNQFSLTFGFGPHLCLGQAIARATIEEALAVFVERCDEIELLNEPRWKPFVMENKLDSLRVGFKERSAAVAH